MQSIHQFLRSSGPPRSLARFLQCGTKSLAVAAVGLALCLPASLRAEPILIDFGVETPIVGIDDVAQATAGAEGADGLNYYFDNGAAPGQTFTTGSNPNGYTLSSLSLYTAGNSGQIPAAGQAYTLRIFSVAGTTATPLATYTSTNNFVFTDYDWLQWTNLGVTLSPNTQYAYSFSRISAGWELMGNISANPYAGGEVALIPAAGGTMTFGATHDFDAVFVVGLTPVTTLVVNPPTIEPGRAVVVGATVTNSVTVVGPPPYNYQWRTDGGSGGALTNIPNAISASLVVDTTGYALGAYKYDMVVTNNTTSATSDTITLAVIGPVSSAALTDLGGTASPGPNDITQYVGGGNRDGLNYYDDDGANNNGWTGQTFTTGTNTQGYYLTSVSFQTGGGTFGGIEVVQPYHLYIYSVEGATATLMAHYTNSAFSFADGDWLKWSGFNVVLQSGKTYAYAFGRAATGTGWEALAVSPNTTDLYQGGQMCLIPAAGGSITFGATGLSDAVFDVGLLPVGVGPDPKPFAGTIAVTPSRAVIEGTTVTLSQAASGTAPLAFQWRTDGGTGGVFTNIPSATGTNLVMDTAGLRPAAYQFDFVVSNSYGLSTAAPVTVTIIYTNSSAVIADIGANVPTPVASDLSQITVPAGANNPDGLNYYFDNNTPPGQTFATGSNPSGYVLTSLAIKLAGNSGSIPAAGQYYVLRIYSVSGNNAILYATYTSQDGFTYTSSDWLRWTGIALPLPANSTFAYTLARNTAGSGWENLANVSGNPYAGGEVAMIPTGGGPITFGASHDFDATFVVGLAMTGYPYVSPVEFSPSATVYAGTPVTLTAPVTGTGPFTYQWRTDGGNAGGPLNTISGARDASLKVDTTGMDGLNVSYDVVVGNGSGSTTSEQSTMTVLPASLPVLISETAPAIASAFAGDKLTFTAKFVGTLPIEYQWQVDHGAGPVKLAGQTNSTLTLANIQPSDAGSYSLSVSNALGAADSTPATLTVIPEPAGPFTANFQWHSTEGANNVGDYTGPGISGFGVGTFWNQVPGPSAWAPGTYTNTTSLADDGATDTGISWTLTTGGSWDWTNAPTIALLDSSASAYAVQPFTFRLPNGRYNIVLFSCNGSEAAVQTNGGALFIINSQTNTALPTTDTKFVEGDNYVVFKNVSVTNFTLAGTWQPVAGKAYGSLNGAQVQFLGAAVTLNMRRIATSKLELQWASGTLVQAPSLTGPWTTNATTSPVTVDTTNSMMFYRVLVR